MMKKFTSILFFVTIFLISSCSNEISQSDKLTREQRAFMKGERINTATKNSYIINGKRHHPFLFHDQLDMIKDKTVAFDTKSKLVYQTIKNHIEINGVTDNDQLDVQKLILYLYGDYSKIDQTIAKISNDQNAFFLNTLIDYKAIDFKYLAKISKHIKSNESYVLPNSKDYLSKYKNIIAEQGLKNEPGYGAHCHNIIESCNKAIELLQNS